MSKYIRRSKFANAVFFELIKINSFIILYLYGFRLNNLIFITFFTHINLYFSLKLNIIMIREKSIKRSRRTTVDSFKF